jgi:hypothetical protein
MLREIANAVGVKLCWKVLVGEAKLMAGCLARLIRKATAAEAVIDAT